MRRVDPIAIYVIIGIVLLVGLAVYGTGTGASHIDYKSGVIREQRSLFGVRYSTQYSETWIAQSSQPDPIPNWGFIGYSGGFILWRARINTKGAKLLAHLSMLENYLLHAGATDEIMQLVAEWVLELIHDIQINRDQFGIAIDAIDCFFDELPFPKDPDESVTYEQIFETIAKCTPGEQSP